MISASLSLVRTLFHLFYPSAHSSGFAFRRPPLHPTSVGWTQFVHPVLEQCLQELKQPDSKMSRLYAGRVLAVAASASQAACELVWSEFWPAVKQRFASPHLQPSQRQALLETVTALVRECSALRAGPSGGSVLGLYLEELVLLYSSALMGSVRRRTGGREEGDTALVTQMSHFFFLLRSQHTEYRFSAIAGLSLLATAHSAPSAASASTSAPSASSSAAAMEVDEKAPASASASSGGDGGGAAAAPATSALLPAVPRHLSAAQLSAVLQRLSALCFDDADSAVRSAALEAVVAVARVHPTSSGVQHVVNVCLEGVTPPSSAAGAAATAATQSKAGAGAGGGDGAHAHRDLSSALAALSSLSAASPAIAHAALRKLFEAVQPHFTRAVTTTTTTTTATSSSTSSAVSAESEAVRAFVQRVLGCMKSILLRASAASLAAAAATPSAASSSSASSAAASASASASASAASSNDWQFGARFAPTVLSALLSGALAVSAPTASAGGSADSRLLDAAIVAEATSILQSVACAANSLCVALLCAWHPPTVPFPLPVFAL